MKNVMLAEPTTIALFGMGFLLLLLLGLLLGAILILIVHFIRKSKKPAPPSAPSAIPATEIIPRKCPQCGAELKPDVSEGLCPACLLQRGIATEGGAPPGTPPFIPPTIPDLARLFPQLEILELIGQGGMGAVYKARQPALDRFVALKILAPRSGSDLDFASRFTREARALAKLSHPNIVGVYDFGRAELPLGQDAQQRVPTTPVHYFIMEFVDGPNLRQVEQAGKLPPREALEIIPQICAALQFAHDEGIVHRDIKPENILLDKKGRVKIADFGLAKILGQEPKDFRLTGARDIMGTPHYMAPEQVEKPQTVDHRADIYSLGVVFYEMLTGELPLGKFQPPSQKVQVDVRLDEVVLRSLAKEPELRYQNVSEIKTRVETIASTNAPAAAPAMSAGEILARDYTLNIRSCLRRGWALVRNDFWPLVGISAFVLVVLSAASSSEVVVSSGKSHTGTTSILGILLSGPLMGGLYLYFLKKIRREAAGVETAFTGFRQPFPHLVIAGFLTSLLTALGFLCLILPGVYLFVAWIFTFPLIVDQRLDFWPAMQLSRKIISKHWWKFLGFLIVLALINLAGLATCCVGLFITFPITFAALAYAYEDITGATASPPGASSSIPSSAPPTPPTPPPDRFWRRFAMAVLALIILVPVGILTLGVLLPVVAQRQIEKQSQLAGQHKTNSPANASAETWSPTLAPGEKPDLQKILNETKDLMNQGRYEEALQRHIWYFNHALEYNPGLTGVRLSFALSNWVELARRYPKAMQALTEIRDRNTKKLVEGNGYSDLFSEVNSINGYLNQDDATYALFKTLDANDPKLAQQCYFYAESLLAQKGEYSLCRKYMGDPQFRFNLIQNARETELDVQKRMARTRELLATQPEAINPQRGWTNKMSPPDTSEMMKKSANDRFVGQTRQLIEILVATGSKEDAEKIQNEAIAVIDDPRLKSAVSDAELKISKRNTVQTLAEQPPVIVETWPISGARDVHPGETEIRVRFSKEMADGSWSWSTAWENSAPETVGQIHYEPDQRTCVLKAKLEPGRTYAWWLNSNKFKKFTDLAGRPAVPYLLIFQTKPN